MPTWNQISQEISGGPTAPDSCHATRQKYIDQLSAKVGRPVIVYYSGWLQKRLPDGRYHPENSVTDNDMNGFMAAVHGLDHSKGLDIVLHTPGGEIEAGRAIVEYLYKIFGRNLQVIVPHMAMSVGTMIACAANSIAMAKHSCLGPTDPQINGIPAMGVLAEVDRAITEIKKEPLKQIVWQQVFSKYPPAFIANCERAVEVTRSMVKDWLQLGMLKGEADPSKTALEVVRQLMDYDGTGAHNHHFLTDKCKGMGLKVVEIEHDQEFQEAVLSVHHSFVATFPRTSMIKIIQSSNGSCWAVET
jgi:hypothetical protein